jgi:pimeloyl-ACP methyl ester carboxylesterase
VRVHLLVAFLILIAAAGPAFAVEGAGSRLIPPVDGPIASPFDAPDSAYGPGHRGIDYAVATGTRVRASGPGVVAFAGNVAGTLAITVDHGGGLESTYSDLAEVWVARGAEVEEGTFIGRSGNAHGQDGLHFGVKLHDVYVDPEGVLGPVDVSEAIHLAPLMWQPSSVFPASLRNAFRQPGTHERRCNEILPSRDRRVPPNDNVAVAIAGIGSRTIGGSGNDVDAEIYRKDPSLLGYPMGLVYEFSYRGLNGERLHERYDRRDTYGDIRKAAAKLATLLTEVSRRHPGRDVDLIAHSQGGLVARTYLATAAKAFEGSQPRVEHLVTFATPHEGAPLAGEVSDLREKTHTGAIALAAARLWALKGGPIPDPYSPAVAQLRPESSFLRTLAREDVMFGTKTLALAIPNDLVVPASRARLVGEASRVVSPRGINGHAAIVGSADGLSIAYDFLRDGALSCRTPWDLWGPRVGRAIALAESKFDGLYRVGEAVGRIFVPGSRLWR